MLRVDELEDNRKRRAKTCDQYRNHFQVKNDSVEWEESWNECERQTMMDGRVDATTSLAFVTPLKGLKTVTKDVLPPFLPPRVTYLFPSPFLPSFSSFLSTLSFLTSTLTTLSDILHTCTTLFTFDQEKGTYEDLGRGRRRGGEGTLH